MAFPTQQQTLADGLTEAIRQAITLKSLLTRASSIMSGNAVSSNQLINLMSELNERIDRWNTVKAIPGIGQYAKDQFDDLNLNIGAEFTAMVNSAQAIITWIEGNFPTDPSGYLLKDKIINGTIEVRQFTPAQTAPLVALVDACIATID